jgi:hypothetical protein
VRALWITLAIQLENEEILLLQRICGMGFDSHAGALRCAAMALVNSINADTEP